VTQTNKRSLQEIRQLYQQRHKTFLAEADALRDKGFRVGNFRGATFAVFVIGTLVWQTKDVPIAGVVAGVSLLAFAFLVQGHGKVLKAEEHKRRFSIVNEHAHKRVTGAWHDLPRAGINFAPKDHAYAGDLDLFGVGSLYQRIGVAHTRYGQQTLSRWIAAPSTLSEIHQRQEAVLELSSEMDFRQTFEAEGMALVEKRRGEKMEISDGPNPNRLLQWIATDAGIAGKLLVNLLSFLIPLSTLGGIVAQVAFGYTPLSWVVPVVLGMILLTATKVPTSETFAAVSTTEGAFLRYGALLELLESHEGKAAWFQDQKKKLLGGTNARPSVIMRRFRNLVSWYDLRHNGMVYPFVNGIFLWDIHCTRALENWKRDTGKDLARWFEIIGEYEALSSLAGLHADDPAATMPTISDSEAGEVSGTRIGHPLLPADQRIENNLEKFSPGEGLLITGSNMSGKSTFLRTLGVNAVLAFTGGPVTAERFSIPLCQLGTSIRISDSLKSGVSHFYAEVQKLAQVVEMTNGEHPVLFLLDEVLHGTNSRERQIGARWVLGELLQKNAFGIITTHDMELCRLPENLMSHVRQHHFRENVKEGEMSFDYTLREGPVTSGNALRLMQRVGLNVPLEEDAG